MEEIGVKVREKRNLVRMEEKVGGVENEILGVWIAWVLCYMLYHICNGTKMTSSSYTLIRFFLHPNKKIYSAIILI